MGYLFTIVRFRLKRDESEAPAYQPDGESNDYLSETYSGLALRNFLKATFKEDGHENTWWSPIVGEDDAILVLIGI